MSIESHEDGPDRGAASNPAPQTPKRTFVVPRLTLDKPFAAPAPAPAPAPAQAQKMAQHDPSEPPPMDPSGQMADWQGNNEGPPPPPEKPKSNVATTGFKAALDAFHKKCLTRRAEWQLALPPHVEMDRFMAGVTVAVLRMPELLDCDMGSLFFALRQAALLGLDVSGALNGAYLIPFANKREQRTDAQLIIGYGGYIDLMHRSGRISAVHAEVVYDADHFEVTKGSAPRIVHIPNYEKTHAGSKIVAAYAVVQLKAGGTQFEVTPGWALNARRDSARGKSPWANRQFFAAMCRKTPIRMIQKYLPLSPSIAAAAMIDERVFESRARQTMDETILRLPREDQLTAIATLPVEEPESD